MGLKNSLENIETILDKITYSNRDISYLNVWDYNIYIPIGGNTKVLLNTDAGDNQEIKYVSDDESIATVDKDGIVTGHSVGTVSILVRSGKFSATYVIHVGEEVHDTASIPEQDRIIDEVEIVNPRATLEVGDEYALQAIGISNTLVPKYYVGYYNPIKFTSSNPEIATVMFGTLMANKAGTCTITAMDLNETASDSFTLTVTPVYVPTADPSETYVPNIDNTGTTDVTVAIANALTYASENHYKKILFPNGKYLMNGDNRPNGEEIRIPSNLIIDFDGSNIYYNSNSTAVRNGYTMFLISDAENVWIRNMNVYAENYNLESADHIKKEGDKSFDITRFSKNIHFENCSFQHSPGWHIRVTNVWNGDYNGAWLRLSNIEPGSIDEHGNNIEEAGAFRSINHIGGATEPNTGNDNGCSGYAPRTDGWTWGGYASLGNIHQAPCTIARLYNIYFYDSNRNFLYMKKNCFVYQRYLFDTNYVRPSFYKIVFFQENMPENEVNEPWGGVGWVKDVANPHDIYITKCKFEDAYRGAISPQGGVHVVVDKCKFKNIGKIDPFSYMDYEDGRKIAQGHIVRYCTFYRDPKWSTYWAHGQWVNQTSTNITFHDNYMKYGIFRTEDESILTRCFHNIFEDVYVRFNAKQDMIVAGNYSNTIPTVQDGNMGDTHIILVDNEFPEPEPEPEPME